MPDPKQKSRQQHEAKPEISRPGYTPSSAANPKWRVGNADRTPEKREDLRTSPELTGQWRHEGELYHLFINQAGEHIEMLLALVESNSQTPWSEEHIEDDGDHRVDDDWDHFRTKNRLFRFGGDRVSAQDNEYALYITQPKALDDKSIQCGSLRCYASSPPEIQLELDYSSLVLPGESDDGLPNTPADGVPCSPITWAEREHRRAGSRGGRAHRSALPPSCPVPRRRSAMNRTSSTTT